MKKNIPRENPDPKKNAKEREDFTLQLREPVSKEYNQKKKLNAPAPHKASSCLNFKIPTFDGKTSRTTHCSQVQKITEAIDGQK